MNDKTDTIVALATSIGTGSIAVVRLSGTDSISITNKIFAGKNLENEKGNTIHFGKISDGGKEIDHVLVSLFRTPHSYTGENSIEISCHSNHYIVEDVIELLVKNGARIAEPGEFTLRAYLNHKIDLSQAEAIANIVASKTRLSTRNSFMQLQGSLSQRIGATKQSLIDLISHMELDLDFSEEGLEIIPNTEILKKVNNVHQEITDLKNSFNKAKYLSGSLEIAIIGKPNAGKSRLLNLLLGEDRAIVTEIPGTTRDTIEENLTLKNMLLKISDTAGIRFSKNQVESQGIKRTWQRIERADLILWVIDISTPMDYEDADLFEKLRKNNKKEIIVVGNKIDIKVHPESNQKIGSFKIPVTKMSAKTGEGLNGLKEMITEILGSKYEQLGEEIIITNKRQFESLNNTLKCLEMAEGSIKAETGNEFVVVELRNALDELGLITGETATDDILNNIFSGFCIGK